MKIIKRVRGRLFLWWLKKTKPHLHARYKSRLYRRLLLTSARYAARLLEKEILSSYENTNP